MSIGTVITEGVGSFGDVAHVVLQGFDTHPAVVNANASILTQAFGAQTAASAFLVTEGFRAGAAAPVTPANEPRGTAGWLWPHADERRSRAEIRKARERFGIPDEVAQAIAEIAARQAERAEQDQQKQFDELYRELELRRIEFDARYLAALSAMREAYIEQAMAFQQREEEEVVILLMAAAAVAKK